MDTKQSLDISFFEEQVFQSFYQQISLVEKQMPRKIKGFQSLSTAGATTIDSTETPISQTDLIINSTTQAGENNDSDFFDINIENDDDS